MLWSFGERFIFLLQGIKVGEVKVPWTSNKTSREITLFIPKNYEISEFEQWIWENDTGALILGEEKISCLAVSKLPCAAYSQSRHILPSVPQRPRPLSATFSVTESLSTLAAARSHDRPTVRPSVRPPAFRFIVLLRRTARFTRRRKSKKKKKASGD